LLFGGRHCEYDLILVLVLLRLVIVVDNNKGLLFGVTLKSKAVVMVELSNNIKNNGKVNAIDDNDDDDDDDAIIAQKNV
jgi:hypothetical protein